MKSLADIVNARDSDANASFQGIVWILIGISAAITLIFNIQTLLEARRRRTSREDAETAHNNLHPTTTEHRGSTAMQVEGESQYPEHTIEAYRAEARSGRTVRFQTTPMFYKETHTRKKSFTTRTKYGTVIISQHVEIQGP